MGCVNSTQTETDRDLALSIPQTEQLVNSAQTAEEFLGELNTFKSMPKPQIAKLARSFEVVNYPMFKEIIAANSVSEAFYIISDGCVQVSIISPDNGKPTIIREMKASEGFGEYGLVHDVPVVASYYAKTPVTVLRLTRIVYDSVKADRHMRVLKNVIENAAEGRVEKALANVPIVKDIGKEKLHILSRTIKVRQIPRGYKVCKQGEIGDKYFILSSGELLVTHKDKSGVEMKIGVLRDGASFGEISLLSKDKPRSASVTAAKESYLLSITRDEFMSFLALIPSVRHDMSKGINDRYAFQSVTSKIPFFNHLTTEKLLQMSTVFSMQKHRPNEKIIRSGKVGDSKFYIVYEGTLHVLIDGKPVRDLEANDYFGEVSIVNNLPPTATVRVSRTKPAYLLECSKQDFLDLFADEPSVLAEINIRISGRSVELKHILHHAVGQDAFVKHCSKEFARENVVFWKDVEFLQSITQRTLDDDSLDILGIDPDEYRKTIDAKVRTAAMGIYDKYCAPEAPYPININAEEIGAIRENVEQGNICDTLYDDAKKTIYDLMERDNFSRFKASTSFARMLEEIGIYQSSSRKSSK